MLSENRRGNDVVRIGGIVLCGGESSRMGRPKAWLPFGDEVLLQRVVRVVGDAVGPVVVVAAPGQAVPPLPDGVEVVRDAVTGRGPLEGLAAGLAALAGRADAAYLSACDLPFLTAEFVKRVVASLPPPGSGEGWGGGRSGPEATPHPNPPPQRGREVGRIAVPDIGGYRHPLAAVYRVDVLAEVRRLLVTGNAGPKRLFEVVPTRFLGADVFADIDSVGDSLRNVNTPEEYAAALRELGLGGSG